METIIVATDFSPAANNATEYAIELAKFFCAKLVLVNAFPLPIADVNTIPLSDLITVSENEALSNLNSLRSTIENTNQNKIKVDCFAAMGSPIDVISQAIEIYKAGLLVTGIKGQAGLIKKHIIGSNAILAAKHLNVYSIIVPENAKYKRIRKLSFACDLNKTEESSLIYTAKYFTRLFDAELEIVNIENGEVDINSKKKTLAFIEDKLELVDHKNNLIEGTNPVKTLNEHFHSQECDLIMLNPKKHNIFHQVFHPSVSRQLIFNSELPVLIIH